MKLEIEISEDEIRSALERKLRIAVAEHTHSWTSDEEIKRRLKELWSDSVDKILRETLDSSDALREKATMLLEAKIKAQLQAVINKAKI